MVSKSVHDHEGAFDRRAIGFESVVIGDQRGGLLGEVDGERVDGTRCIEKRVFIRVERAERDKTPSIVDHEAERLSLARVFEIGLRRRDNDRGGVLRDIDAVDDLAVRLHQRRDGKSEEAGARQKELMEQAAVSVEHHARPIEIGGRQARFLQQRSALRFAEHARRLRSAVNEPLHLRHEHRIERALECDGADDREQQRREQSDDREEADDADMKTGRRLASPPGAKERARLRHHQHDEQHKSHRIGDEQHHDDVVGRRERPEFRQHKEGRKRARDGCENCDRTKPIAQRPTAARRRGDRLFFRQGHAPV